MFNMTASDVQFSLIESALYLSVFADGTDGANRDWVHVLFSESNFFFFFCSIHKISAVGEIYFGLG